MSVIQNILLNGTKLKGSDGWPNVLASVYPGGQSDGKTLETEPHLGYTEANPLQASGLDTPVAEAGSPRSGCRQG